MTAPSTDRVEFRRLRKRAEFLRAGKGKRAGRANLSVQMADAASDMPGLGFTVTKKAGNSPERNRIRRRLRAAARACGPAFRPQHDYVLIGRREALSTPFSKLCAELTSALGKVHANQPAGS